MKGRPLPEPRLPLPYCPKRLRLFSDSTQSKKPLTIPCSAAPGLAKSCQAVLCHLQPSHHLSGCAGILRLRQHPDFAQVVPLSTGTGSGLALLWGIEMPAAGAAEYYEIHWAGRSTAFMTPSWPGRLVILASPISVLITAPRVRMLLLI